VLCTDLIHLQNTFYKEQEPIPSRSRPATDARITCAGWIKVLRFTFVAQGFGLRLAQAMARLSSSAGAGDGEDNGAR